ncbi:hypothetical protein BC834DRAFT_872947 [Gloeopeniophorella convolvens]|nr:hypothetical protein BC834DRAFT_872947 [Gloeopeniophorella convolvens]
MVSHLEKRIVWSPLGQNRFIVGGGSQLTLYDWSSEDSSIHHVASQHDLQSMKCFAWSPDPIIDDLVAVGSSNGRVDILRLESTRHIREHSNGRNSYAPLPVKIPRTCASLAFCGVTPQYLAVGLEKVRNDTSLIIWDIHTSTPSHVSTPSTSSASHIVAPPPSPARPTTALPPAGRQYHPIPRTDLGARADSRCLQVHAQNEAVHSLAWLPQSNSLLAAGLSQRLLRLFDLRNSSPMVANVQGRVYALATDPFEPYHLAAAGDGVVTIWDTRKMPTPLLTFNDRDAFADGARTLNYSLHKVTHLEFSTGRRGVLATLGQDSAYIRLWNTIKTDSFDIPFTSEKSRGSDGAPVSRTPKMSWTNATSMLPWSASGAAHNITTERDQAQPSTSYALTLSDTRKSRRFHGNLASFALMPAIKPNPLSTSIMAIIRDDDLETAAIHDTPTHALWSARGNLAVAVGSAYRVFSSVQPAEAVPEPWAVVPIVTPENDSGISVGAVPVEEVSRGRSLRLPIPPAFGRGDEDGFPALTSARPSPKPSPHTRPSLLPVLRVKDPGLASPAHRSAPASPRIKANVELPSSAGPPSRASPTPAAGSRNVSGPTKSTEATVPSRARSAGGGRPRRRAVDRVQSLVDEDISMCMRRRVVKGYGLSNLAHNAAVLKDSKEEQDERALVEMWSWMEHARQMLEGPPLRLNGYNFANQGIQGIWEGFPSSNPNVDSPSDPVPASGPLLDPLVVEGVQPMSRSQSRRSRHRGEVPTEFSAALTLLSAYHQPDGDGPETVDWKPTIQTFKLTQRRFALQLCGWSLKNEDVYAVINKWEKEGRQSQAACWLVFLGRHSKAVDVLMRSKDSSHNIMSGTLAALGPTSAKTPELRHQYERLIMRLEDPYFRAMLTYLALGDWGDVLEEEHIPLRERLAVALQFLEDDALSAYLRRIAEASVTHGDVEGLIVTGLTTSGMQLLQVYVDRTGDVQTAAILGAYVHPHHLKDARVDRWLDTYRNLLDGWKFFHHRCQLDIDRGQMLQELMQVAEKEPVQLVPPQILIRCNYCNRVISDAQGANAANRATACPFCNRPLPRCSVCLMTLNIIPDAARNCQLAHHNASTRDTVDDAIVFCQTCRHGGHAAHILEWFYGETDARSHMTCAVADCDHRCADEF